MFALLLLAAEHRHAAGWSAAADLPRSMAFLHEAAQVYPFDFRFREAPKQRLMLFLTQGR